NTEAGMMYSSVAIGSTSHSWLVLPNLSASYQRPSSSTTKLAFQLFEMTHARRDGEIGREGLVVRRVDILQAAREGEPVDVDVGRVEEALELGTGVDRHAQGQVADRRRPGQVSDRKGSPRLCSARAHFLCIGVEVEGREDVEPKLRPHGLLLASRR